MIDSKGTTWTKSTKSNNNGGCVEIGRNGALGNRIGIRDTKDRDAGAIVIDRTAFAAFLGDVKTGALDI